MKSKRVESRRLFGVPEPEKFASTPEGKVLTECAGLHFRSKSKKDTIRLLEIEKLVLDIFRDSQTARIFAVNPEKYMRDRGFSGVKLDMNSQEIKAAMAIGDPTTQKAAKNGDLKGFIDAILAQGIKPSTLGPLPFACVEAIVAFSALILSCVETSYVIAVKVGGKVPFLDRKHHKNLLVQIAKYIGDARFTKMVTSKKAEKLIDSYIGIMSRTTGNF